MAFVSFGRNETNSLMEHHHPFPAARLSSPESRGLAARPASSSEAGRGRFAAQVSSLETRERVSDLNCTKNSERCDVANKDLDNWMLVCNRGFKRATKRAVFAFRASFDHAAAADCFH